tara:strand:+ start:766 stop:1167 length:402 start_codon:yes stop_codon:yes gene_type:complete
MNSVLMATYVAGSLMSTATFGTMDECSDARLQAQKYNAGNDVTVVCTYQETRKQISPLEFFKSLIEAVQMLNELEDRQMHNAFPELTGTDDDQLPEYMKEHPFKCNDDGVLAVQPNRHITESAGPRVFTKCGS